MDHNCTRATVLGALAAAGALLLAAPTPRGCLRLLTAATPAADLTGPLVAALALLAWAGAAYLLIATMLSAGAHLPGRTGAVLSRLAQRAAPSVLRHAVAVALGAGLVVGTPGGTAAAAAPEGPRPSSSPLARAVPDLDWPGTAARPAVRDRPAARSVHHPAAGSDRPADSPAPRPADVPAESPAELVGAVVVRPGDSLWAIAKARLGPPATDARVAATWPVWWQANREVIGLDPDLLHPGMRLTPPRP